jgi:hypothetical protein
VSDIITERSNGILRVEVNRAEKKRPPNFTKTTSLVAAA